MTPAVRYLLATDGRARPGPVGGTAGTFLTLDHEPRAVAFEQILPFVPAETNVGSSGAISGQPGTSAGQPGVNAGQLGASTGLEEPEYLQQYKIT